MMELKDALQLTERQFDMKKFLTRQGEYTYNETWDDNLFWDDERISKDIKAQKINSLRARNDDTRRCQTIIKMLKKIWYYTSRTFRN